MSLLTLLGNSTVCVLKLQEMDFHRVLGVIGDLKKYLNPVSINNHMYTVYQSQVFFFCKDILQCTYTLLCILT